jgi:hypothetical protein
MCEERRWSCQEIRPDKFFRSDAEERKAQQQREPLILSEKIRRANLRITIP